MTRVYLVPPEFWRTFILPALESGRPRCRVGEQLGFYPSEMSYLCERFGYKKRHYGRAHYSPEVWRYLVLAGAGARVSSRILNLSITACHRHLERAHVELFGAPGVLTAHRKYPPKFVEKMILEALRPDAPPIRTIARQHNVSAAFLWKRVKSYQMEHPECLQETKYQRTRKRRAAGRDAPNSRTRGSASPTGANSPSTSGPFSPKLRPPVILPPERI